jgi:hypothetical protein
LAITHTVAKEKLWLANIDAESEIFEKLDLFNASSSEPIAASEAAGRVTDYAIQEICNFMASQQPVNLAAIQHAARRVRVVQEADNPVVSVLRNQPDQTVTLTTRSGTLKLSLQGVDGTSVADEVRTVVCQIETMGPDRAILKLPKGERQGVPGSAGRSPRLAIPPSLASEELLAEVFSALVLTRANALLKVREVVNRRTGKVTGLLLDEWPINRT